MRSLGRAIVVRVVGALAVVGAVSVAAAYLASRREADQFMDDYLRQFSAVIEPTQIPPKVGSLLEPEDRFERLVWKDGTKVSATAGAPQIAPPAASGFADVTDRGVAWRTFTSARGGYVMTLAQMARSRAEMAQHAAFEISLVVAATMLVVWLIVAASIGLIMRRFRVVGAGIAARGLDATDALDVSAIPVEMKPVVDAMNVLIARLRRALDQQRAFVADSAHELGTPLAALRIQLDNLKAVCGAESGPAVEALDEGVVRAGAVAAQLLRLARFDSRQPRGEAEVVDVVEVVTQCVADFVDIAERAEVDLGLGKVEAVEVEGVRGDLQHLLSNVIDNAVRYTPAGGIVDCEVVRTPDGAVVSIVDTGPGVRPEALLRLTDRFFRAAGSDVPGSGLGLSIVKAIADTHGLALRIANRQDETGLRVSVTLPWRAREPRQ